jgi:hypothetical protein
VTLTTDSNYVRDGITKWVHGWQKNGWKTADRKPVKNGELWQALLEASKPHRIDWRWVKGHAGHPENERADKLACAGAAQLCGGLAEGGKFVSGGKRMSTGYGSGRAGLTVVAERSKSLMISKWGEGERSLDFRNGCKVDGGCSA